MDSVSSHFTALASEKSTKIESVLSLIPSKETITTTQYSSRPYIETGFMAVDKPINNYLGDRYFEGVTVPTNHFANLTTILAIIWLLGTFIMLSYSIISYLRLRRNLRTATILHDNVRQSEMVSSPFILGVIKPKIYLPYHLNETDIEYILAMNRHI